MPIVDFVGTIAVTAVTVVFINAVIAAMTATRTLRLTLAAVIGSWVGLQVALTSAGAYTSPIPYIGFSVVTPLVGAALAAALSPTFRTALLSAPAPLLVGLSASRFIGVFFLVLAANGRLSGPFPYSAGWGDVLTAALAVPLAMAMARRAASRAAILGWNVLGTLDLVAAVGLGLASGNGSPVQLIHAGVGSDAIQALPWSLVPTVLVPIYLIDHAVIFAQYRRTAVPRAAHAISA